MPPKMESPPDNAAPTKGVIDDPAAAAATGAGIITPILFCKIQG